MSRFTPIRFTADAPKASVAIGLATALLGTAAAIYYARLGLTLTHYDARAHLVVARRILDSLTPGWQQIGAVWLPLPHVLNMVPVQFDGWYQTGAFAIAVSIASMAVATGSLAWVLLKDRASSVAAALLGAVLMMLNPNVLYLQSTPMTEPLMFGLSMLGIALTIRWIGFEPGRFPHSAGGVLAAACMTRYEAWAITGAAAGLSACVLLRRGLHWRRASALVLRLAFWPALAIIVFSMNSRWVVGEWFVSGGFFVPENVEAIGNPAVAWRQVDEGLTQLSGTALVWGGYAGAAMITLAFIRSRERASLAVLLALAAAAALPMAAYLQGHPFRIRYDLPLVIAAAAFCAAGVSLLPRNIQWVVATVLLVATIRQATPLNHDAPLVRESQRELAAMRGRQAVTNYLRDHYDGATIMMSMGSLGHYMHDLSSIGLSIRTFLHEGNGKPWEFAMLGPAGRAGWLIIEERAEGGDALYHAARRDRWLDGFTKVAEGGGVTLYRFKVQGSRFEP